MGYARHCMPDSDRRRAARINVFLGADLIPLVVQPDDLSVLEQDQRSMLTLTTCNPVHSARERLVVQAVLADA